MKNKDTVKIVLFNIRERPFDFMVEGGWKMFSGLDIFSLATRYCLF